MSEHKLIFPRIRDLPEIEREPFGQWLRGQTCPYDANLSWEDNDYYYPWDYSKWKALKGRQETVAEWD